ncbi:hypothetical protein C1631_016400 [Chryseobacterium phosphatilyticum]|uniref:Uncharacterized protein n=1 Tax=Chryseobacterium phosphatilyticum TaxID=475075 RepID=A0A316X3G4_9FLAO|nr:hypothetical protein [Chryseobacterium phosphatilyticum]PWN68281.1 hypothetical protein C1631_016400 [Chryseobacterium phosphatilyticum]
MKNRKNYLLLMIFFMNILFSQVGIGTANPRGALDINKETTNNMGLVLPTNSDPGNLINPMGGNVAIGTIMYDSTLSCVRVYKSSGWSKCLCDQCGPTPGFTLDCSTGALSGTFIAGVPSTGTKTINYTNASGQPYNAISVTSTGVTGLTATAPAGTLANGSGNISLTVSGTPSGSGIASFVVSVAGESCSFTINVNGEGTFDNPSVSCQSIFDKYNSSGILVANDGEYWIGTATNKYKTRCDMVDAAEAAALDKEVGGYTLLWSYSEGTATKDNAWGTNGTVSWGATTLDNRNVVKVQNGTMNYNNFRIETTEKARWTGKVTRQTFTDEPTNSNKDLNTYLNYPKSDIVNGGLNFRLVGSGTVTGKYLGGVTSLTKNAGDDRGTLTIDNVMIKNNIYFYNGDYNTHWDITDYRYSPTINGGNGAIISNWPLWVVGEWTSEMPFGRCINGLTSYTPLAPQGGGYPVKTFTDACLPNNANIGRHPGINGTEGYVMQWWAK